MNQNVPMKGFPGRKFFLAAGILVGLLLVPNQLAAQDADDAKAYRLQQSAAAAMEEEAWSDAIALWQNLIDKHPDSPRLRKAWYGMGKCHYLRSEFDKAIPAFEKAIPLLQKEGANSLDVPDALLLLGYSRLQTGREIVAAAPDAGSIPDEASIELTTAAEQHFAAILSGFPEFAKAHEAAHFQGQAFAELGRLDQAKASFEKSLGFENKSFQLENLYSLGAIADRQRKYEQSAEWYQKLIDAAGTEPHKLLTETKYHFGEAMMRLGEDASEQGDKNGFRTSFIKARGLLSEAGEDRDFPLRDRVLYQKAFCSLILGEKEKAARGFEEVMNMADSTLADQAKVRAAEAWIGTGDSKRGRGMLEQVMDEGNSWAIDAAHIACRSLIDEKRPKDALGLASQWVGKSKDHPKEVFLLMDQADAMSAVEGSEAESAELFADIAEKFKSAPVAPEALYASAVVNAKYGKPELALEQVATFMERYEGDDYTSSMLEVKAEALLLTKEYSEAESGFRNLVNDYSEQTEKLGYWITRAGLASYSQKNYDQTIDWLEKNEGKITDPKRKAESLYWIGASHYQKDEFAESVRNLEQSLTASSQWSRAPEVMLALCNALVKTDATESARDVANELKQQYQDNPGQNVSRAFYVLGEHEKEKENWDAAVDAFDVVAKDYQGNEWTENAAYQAAFCLMQKGDLNAAATRFTAFADKWPDSKYAADAKLAASNAMRSSGNTEGAIERLKQLVEQAKDPATKNRASLQLGLGYVDQEMWAEAIEVFDGLTQTDGQSESADTYWYELAWAQRSSGNNKASLESFTSLVKKFPQSDSAPEAHFFLASKAYSDKQYDAAIDHYRKADVESARDEIREKARYKLAWSHFRKKEFAVAGSAFRKQVDGFPEGILYADGMYMVGQSAYREDKFQEAFDAFAAARATVEKSEAVSDRIKTNTLLFGARSGNKVKRYQQAAQMAQALTEHPQADKATIEQGWLELGVAQTGLGQPEQAMEALGKASDSDGVAGAKALALLGDAWFAKAVQAAKDGNPSGSDSHFEEAIDVYRRLYFGFRNSDSSEIKSWQAYAAYESGRCNMVRIKTAAAEQKPGLIAEAKRHFKALVKKFPEDKLAADAQKQLTTLERLEQ